MHQRGQFTARTLTEGGVKRARLVRGSLEKDATFAQACVCTAKTYVLSSDVVLAPNEALSKALRVSSDGSCIAYNTHVWADRYDAVPEDALSGATG